MRARPRWALDGESPSFCVMAEKFGRRPPVATVNEFPILMPQTDRFAAPKASIVASPVGEQSPTDK